MLFGCSSSNPETPKDEKTGENADVSLSDSPCADPETAETEEPRLPSSLLDTDLDGFTLTMLQCHFAENGAWREELTGENVNDAIFNRNIYIQDKYNCKFELIESTEWHPCEKEIPEAVASGDDLFDVVFDGGGAFANRIEHYKNLNDLSYTALEDTRRDGGLLGGYDSSPPLSTVDANALDRGGVLMYHIFDLS